MKETFYFPHDYNARGDEKIIPLLRGMGAEGYGLYWLLVEKLYEGNGRISQDFENIAYDLRTTPDKIKRLVKDFNLFFIDKKQIGSKSVDRRLSERRDRSEKARQSAYVRHATAQRPQSDRYAINESKEIKEIKEIKVNGSRICIANYRGRPDCGAPALAGSKYCEHHKLKAAEFAQSKGERQPGLHKAADVIAKGPFGPGGK